MDSITNIKEDMDMDYLQTEKILIEIYKEQKTIAKFMDTIFQFLLRHTNFRLMEASKRIRLWQIFLDELSLIESELHTTTDSIPPAATEIEVGTESNNAELNFGVRLAEPIRDQNTQMQIVASTEQVYADAVNFDEEGDEGLPQHTTVPNRVQRLKKQRKILPKVKGLIPNNAQGEEQISENLISKQCTKRLYKCSDCTERFVSFRHLKMHETLHTSQADDGISVCVYCCSLYANSETLEKHINDCHGEGRRYLCVPCAKTYKNRGQLLKHVHSNIHSANTLLYYCSLCPRAGNSYIEFTSRGALQQHYQEMHLLMPVSQDEDDVEIEMNEEFLDEFLLNNVNDNSFNFSECWDALDLNLPDMLHLTNNDTNEVNLNADKCNAEQGNESLFKCPICKEGCSNQKLLLQHFAHKHELPMLICNKCDSSFSNYTQWLHHKSTHRNQLDSTQTDKHNPLQCEICDKILRSNAALNYHVKTHLRNFLQAAHECPYCRKQFRSEINLKQHILIVHSHIKRHICELCDKPFATLDHLKKHVLSQHQNERKHKCDVCSKSFTQSCHLKQHMAIHTTGKTHQCSKCEGKFWRKIDLRRHMLKRHA